MAKLAVLAVDVGGSHVKALTSRARVRRRFVSGPSPRPDLVLPMCQVPRALKRLQAAAKPEVHPDADVLTAFAENLLNERERLNVLGHLSACADCRELVSLAQPELPIEQVEVAAAAAAPMAATSSVATTATPARVRWSSKFIFGWAAVAASLVVAAAWTMTVLVQVEVRPDWSVAAQAMADGRR